ncbi:substance-K receptor-like [Octopus vulgaris]|uniref:Substance-K receptor-like n=1 Tax=Octopus vulgaris TaxID=6645 RepID=A0AA36FH81_OCTVU|nr:substance-K receptor-like [Octopus vulgaris]
MEEDEFSDLIGLDQNFTTTVSLVNESGGYYGLTSQLTPEAQTFLIVLYSLTTFASVFGNILSIIVFAKGKKCKTDIKPFLLNLAVADLIMGIFCIPFTLVMLLIHKWIFSPVMCTLVSFLQLFSATMSVSTNMAIGVDRLIAVLFPLKIRITSSRSSCMIALIWLFSVAIASVQLFVARVDTTYYEGDIIMECNEQWDKQSYRLIYTWVVSVFLCFIPLTILTVTYSILANVLWKRRAPGNADKSRDQLAIRAKIKVVKMLVTIVVLFGICWLPIHIYTLFIDYHPELFGSPTFDVMLVFIVVHWLAMAHSFMNPIIYGFMNDNFRDDLIELVKKSRIFSSETSTETSKDSTTVKKNNFREFRMRKLFLGLRDKMFVLADRNGSGVSQERQVSSVPGTEVVSWEA